MSAEHEMKMGCFCKEGDRIRYKDGSSKCSRCDREWTSEDDKKRALRVRRLKAQHRMDLKEIRNVMRKGKKDGKAVWLEYIDRHDNLTERLIEPRVTSGFGVVAFCHARRGERLFRYRSIYNCRVVDVDKDRARS